MRKELLYNPRLLIERIAELSADKRRRAVLKGTRAEKLQDSQISSLEFLQMASKSNVSVLYDLGANAGTWTVLSHVIIPHAEIHAFETHPEYQQAFSSNTSHIAQLTLHKVAAGNDNKNATFNFSGHSSSFFQVSENLLKMFPNERKTGELTVQMVRLDDYVSAHNIKLPDLMKLDVEGYELEVLRNAIKCLQHCKYVILEASFIERHVGQPLFAEVVQFMADNDFGVHAFPVKMHLGQPILMADIMFKNLKVK